MLLDHGRETLGTSALDAEPDVILRMPGDTLAPLLLAIALAVLFIGMLIQSWWLSGTALAASLRREYHLALARSPPRADHGHRP